MKNIPQAYYKPIQRKMPVDIERMIDVDDPVYSFNEVLCHIDLKRYFVAEKEHKTGRLRYDEEKLLKVILFAFMEEGYQPLRKIEKLCLFCCTLFEVWRTERAKTTPSGAAFAHFGLFFYSPFLVSFFPAGM